MDILEFQKFEEYKEYYEILEKWEDFLKSLTDKRIGFEVLYAKFRNLIGKQYNYEIVLYTDVLRYELFKEYLFTIGKEIHSKCPICSKEVQYAITDNPERVRDTIECKDIENFAFRGKVEGCAHLLEELYWIKFSCGHKIPNKTVLCPECMKESIHLTITDKCKVILECGHEISCDKALNSIITKYDEDLGDMSLNFEI